MKALVKTQIPGQRSSEMIQRMKQSIGNAVYAGLYGVVINDGSGAFISDVDENTFLEADAFTPKPYFWQNTLLGKMMPFRFAAYVEFTAEGLQFSENNEYQQGLRALYTYDEKYPSDGSGPLRLAFMSSSLAQQADGVFAGVIIYEITK